MATPNSHSLEDFELYLIRRLKEIEATRDNEKYDRVARVYAEVDLFKSRTRQTGRLKPGQASPRA